MTTSPPSLPFDDLIEPIHGTPFATLRRGQEVALRQYCTSAHGLADLAIELPTGAGKSLIALLILEFWRRQGRKAAILTGNKALARQLEGEANALGVPTVRFQGAGRDLLPVDRHRYHRATAIAIMNYWVYINQNPAVQPAEVLVLDDAQLAEGSLTSLLTASIRRRHHPALFDALVRRVAERTGSQIARDAVLEIASGPSPYRPVDLVPFSQFSELAGSFRTVLDEYLLQANRDDDAVRDLAFRWDRVRDGLEQCLCLFSSDELELRPGCFPTHGFAHLSQPTQRIYLGATIHDPLDLQRRLGTGPIIKLQLPPEVMHEEDGRRLFVLNQQVTIGPRQQVPQEVLGPMFTLLRRTRKSLWLCSSASEADRWAEILEEFEASYGPSAAPVWRLGAVGDELDHFRGAAQGHLLVAGRFEGMDFPDGACRLAVLPSVPSAANLLERFTTEQLRDAEFQLDRVRERIKQGIGRCTRGRQDYALYVFLDPQFLSIMENPAFGHLVTEQTRRQVELGIELTLEGVANALPLAGQFLSGDFQEFDERFAAASPPPLRPLAAPPPSTAGDEVIGWVALFERRNYPEAVRRFARVVDGLVGGGREHRGFWCYLTAFAEYLRHAYDADPGARARALGWLDRAIQEGATASWFNRLRRATNELRGQAQAEAPIDVGREAMFEAWDAMVERLSYDRGRFDRWQVRLQTNLQGSHDQCAEGLEMLGTALGYTATRPAGDGMPDATWRGAGLLLTLEAKIETTRTEVVLSDVNQADGQRRAAAERFEEEEDAARGLIVTNLTTLHHTARPALGSVRIVSVTSLEALRVHLEGIMANYWRAWSRSDAQARIAAREAAARRLPPQGWLARAIDSTADPYLTAQALLAEWPGSE